MSEDKKKADRRYVGKVKNTQTQYGVMSKIMMDNLSPTKEDGTPDQYYQGALIWADAKTGKNYHVKQFQLWIPREGMNPALAAKGFSHFITLDLEDGYQVTVLG